ncbi:MAG: amidase, partial [Betaproteobacteria bacterium]|nr:amidase [Betaproteobacteria bacterium]
PDPSRLSATEAAAAIAAKRLTSEALVTACLERVNEREGEVRAWAFIDRELALREARERDKHAPRTRLHGIPVGVKDVIDTFDMPTEYGSPIYRGNRPGCDAACVAQVREAGGVILGKTVSTEFATRHPGKTRNPRNLEHTPGGSSSGSAAAVADLMVPTAFGTQTSSSIIRPAAYCGTVGYKPSFNTVNRAGIKFLSESLDTIGVLTRTVPDAALIVEELSGSTPARFEEAAALKPRIGFCHTPYWHHADAPTQAALEGALPRLSAAGATAARVDFDGDFARLAELQVVVSGFEFYRALSYERARFPELISENLMSRILAGGRVSRAQYEEAMAIIERCRTALDDVFREHDVLVAPSAPGEAPRGLASTGDPVFGLMWTALHTPCVTLPVFTGPAGLPLGLQVIGRRGEDARTLLCAEWIRRTLQ